MRKSRHLLTTDVLELGKTRRKKVGAVSPGLFYFTELNLVAICDCPPDPELRFDVPIDAHEALPPRAKTNQYVDSFGN
jgi:hypothetical protein